MGRHHESRKGLRGILAAVLVFVAVGVATGMVEGIGQGISEPVKELLPWTEASPSRTEPVTAPPRSPATIPVDDPPVDIQLETDSSKFNVRPGLWTVPADTRLPAFPDGCYELDAWAATVPAAVPMTPVYRVTLTGRSEDQVVVHRVWANVVERRTMPDGLLSLSCPMGSPIMAVAVEIDLGRPLNPTYQDADASQLPHLAYALAKGEPGVFYVSAWSNELKLMTVWDLMVEVTVGGKTVTLNLNQLKRNGEHFVAHVNCNTTGIEFGGEQGRRNTGVTRC